MMKKLNAKNTIKKKYSGDNWKINNSHTPEERNKILESMLFPDEYLGEEFSEIDKKNSYRPPFEVSFDIRIIPYRDGTVELCYKTKNAATYKKEIFEGLTPEQAADSFNLFCREIVHYLNDTSHILFSACKERQNENLSERREFLNEWIKTLSIHYRKILGLGREKLIEVSEENGIENEIFVFIDSGASPKTEDELKKERREFLTDIYFAFKKFKQNHVRKPKQKDLRLYLFESVLDREKKISVMLKKHNLNFKKLWQLYQVTDNKDHFVNIAFDGEN